MNSVLKVINHSLKRKVSSRQRGNQGNKFRGQVHYFGHRGMSGQCTAPELEPHLVLPSASTAVRGSSPHLFNTHPNRQVLWLLFTTIYSLLFIAILFLLFTQAYSSKSFFKHHQLTIIFPV